ncbi:MAG: 16S rRNA (cytosine(1402)-N(4))-methyltransferase RsmH [Alphaproteobacteria bacterium]|nr:16S rRNA (cytosine(1402)-N(4))-methyltransferase RsmH [Alphaproteobacteria bacterium]
MMKHIPVLLDSVIKSLGDLHGKRVVDCTFGAGGYTRAFLGMGASVIAFDRDPNVTDDAKQIQKEYGNTFRFIPETFSHLNDLDEQFDAIVFDLGISSMQIDIADRGFSFRMDGPLDMRMSGNGLTAAELIAKTPTDELAQILREYGDVKKANLLARVMREKLPKTTFELRDLIHNPNDIAPVFQALRIAVNDEFGELKRALASVPDKLVTGGKCICVTFHSIEDRIVKTIFRDWTTPPGDVRLPTTRPAPFEMIKPAKPSGDEIKNNPRSRSAHMRGVIKTC